MDERPDYGPRGYLPERAAKRARKIVLREQLGVGWIVASVIAGIVLLVVGGLFAWWSLGPPRGAYTAVLPIAQLPQESAVQAQAEGLDILVVRARGRLVAFRAPPVEVAYCRQSGHLEGVDGTVWDLDGARVSHPEGLPSLLPLDVTVHAGEVYVVPRAEGSAPPPRDAGLAPVCTPSDT